MLSSKRHHTHLVLTDNIMPFMLSNKGEVFGMSVKLPGALGIFVQQFA